MTQQRSESQAPAIGRPAAPQAPFIRAPEDARTVFLVTLVAACAPLAAGVILFGWRAAVVASISVVSCALIERVYYYVTRTPALLGRTHAYLTGVLLALTMPPDVPWYIPMVAAAFAVIMGKAVFGGVGHFLWQPALVGRLAVAVMFPATLSPAVWPLLGRDRLLVGDVRNVRTAEDYRGWRERPAPLGKDGFRLPLPSAALAKLTRPEAVASRYESGPAYSGLAYVRTEIPGARPAALRAPPPHRLPPMKDLLYGTRPGGIGETSAVIIIIAGLYLVYRNYVRWQLPFAIIASAWCVAAVAPVKLAGPNATTETVYLPLLFEGLDVGVAYVSYQILSGELLLAAVLLATEMTSRPVTTGGQVIFGVGCGTLAMLMQLYVNVPIPAYMAVLAMNTLSPAIDTLWRPRVFGRGRLEFLRRRATA